MEQYEEKTPATKTQIKEFERCRKRLIRQMERTKKLFAMLDIAQSDFIVAWNDATPTVRASAFAAIGIEYCDESTQGTASDAFHGFA